MPSLNFFLDVTSPDIPSTTAVCSGFLNLYSKLEHCESCLPPVKTLKQMVCQGGSRKRSQGVRRCNNPFAKQNYIQPHLSSFPSLLDGFPFIVAWTPCPTLFGVQEDASLLFSQCGPCRPTLVYLCSSILYRHTNMSGVSIPVQCLCV